MGSKVKHGVADIAFVCQGNHEAELPEALLGCARMFRVDFLAPHPLPTLPPDFEPDRLGESMASEESRPSDARL